MSDHIVSTAMPHALHPNCYLDVLFSEDENEILGGSSFHLSAWFESWIAGHIDSLLSEVLRKTKANSVLLPCPVQRESRNRANGRTKLTLEIERRFEKHWRNPYSKASPKVW